MTTPITLILTADDLTIDRHSNGGCCAIARSAKRVIPERFAWVTLRALLIDAMEKDKEGYPISDTTVVRFPEHVLAWHRAFMTGRPVEPIAFTLHIPDLPARAATP